MGIINQKMHLYYCLLYKTLNNHLKLRLFNHSDCQNPWQLGSLKVFI